VRIEPRARTALASGGPAPGPAPSTWSGRVERRSGAGSGGGKRAYGGSVSENMQGSGTKLRKL